MRYAAITLASLAIAAGIGIVAGRAVRDGASKAPAASPPPAVARIAIRPASTPSPPVADPAPSDDIPAAFAALGLKPDMSYVAVKARLATGGYRPAAPIDRDCASIGETECDAFPEIEVCAGTGAGFCSARFAGSDGALHNVITQGPGGPLVRIFAALPGN